LSYLLETLPTLARIIQQKYERRKRPDVGPACRAGP
jgi:hypothetical protein